MSKSKFRSEYEAMFGVVKDSLRLYDANGIVCYYEDSEGWWSKRQFDADGNVCYYEDSDGWWNKREYDADGNRIYYETSYGTFEDKRPCADKVFIDEQTGKKFKMMEVK